MAHPLIALGTLAVTALGGGTALVATTDTPPAPAPWAASTPWAGQTPQDASGGSDQGSGGGQGTWYGVDPDEPGLVHKLGDDTPPAKAKAPGKAPAKPKAKAADKPRTPTTKAAPTKPRLRWLGRTTCPRVQHVDGVKVVVVRSGDSAWHIADCADVTVTALAEANHLSRGGALVRVGQQLEIPAATR